MDESDNCSFQCTYSDHSILSIYTFWTFMLLQMVLLYTMEMGGDREWIAYSRPIITLVTVHSY